MWGIRAIRVGVLLVGMVVVAASSGCFECCKNLCGGEKSVPASSAPPAGEAGQSHPTFERVHGEIQ